MGEPAIKCRFDKEVPLSELKPHPKNRNKHPDEQIDRLAQIIEYQGIRHPIVVSQLSGFITKGHGRLAAAKKLGLFSFPVEFQEYESDAQEYADIQADNAIALWAELDFTGISEDIKAFGDDLDLDMLGIEGFEPVVPTQYDEEKEDDVPETPIEPTTKPGDLYQLGNHRLLCGDSTNMQHVDRLLDGAKVDMVFTDPPYGIGFKYNSHQDTTGDEYKDFCRDWFHNVRNLAEFIIISTGWAYNKFWYSYDPDDCFYWLCKNKRTGGSISHFRKVEPLFVWGRPKNKYDFDFFEQTSEIEQGLKGKHTCPKPISLIQSIIDNGCKTVLDVFGGSGTTLIACEKTNRKCFMMEIDPKYCDVIVERWETYTGRKAELVSE